MAPATIESHRLLAAAEDPGATARAWAAFLADYSTLILEVALTFGGDHDVVMDRYAFILDSLRRDDCRRLHGYVEDGRGSFRTWLVVVVGRLCHDERRHRYGRPQGETEASARERSLRRNLVDLVGAELEVDSLESSGEDSPEVVLRRSELAAALRAALDGLDASDRLLLRLRFEDALSVPEIARTLGGTSPFSLYRRLDKVLARIRQRLVAAGVDDAAP